MGDEIKAFVVNTKVYDDGDRNCGEWVSFPVTKEEMKAVYNRIGIDGTHFKDIFLDDFRTDVAGLRDILNIHTDIDELNYLAICLSDLPSEELAKLDAIAEISPYESIKAFIDFAPNADYYVLIEGVKNAEDLGNYYLYKSGMVQMPEEWKSGIDPKAFGEHIQKDELGKFTKAGYLIDSDDLWLDEYRGKEDIHEAFLVSPQAVFKQPEKEKPSVMEQLGKINEQIGKSTNPAHKKTDMEL